MSGAAQHSFLADDDPAPDADDTTLEGHPTDPPAAIRLELLVRDSEVIDALWRHADGRPRSAFALDALRIGVLALRDATAQADAALVRSAGAELLERMQQSLQQHATLTGERTGAFLKEYFDPHSGKLTERVGRLVGNDGELAQLLRSQLHGDASPLAKTLSD
ncbi:MAG: hypothetical protein AAF790_03080, partial [Planctomycetota bacterium]